MLNRLSRQEAIDLLKKNEQVLFARYGMWSTADADMIVASVDHLLETLDPDELKTSMLCVALAADAYEKQHGGDDF